MPLAVWQDFTPLLALFGAQRLEVHVFPTVSIDPDTNEEYYSGTPVVDYISGVVVPASTSGSQRGEYPEFLPKGILDQAQYIIYAPLQLVGESGNEIPQTIARGKSQPLIVMIDGRPFGVIYDQKWHAGNMRVLAVAPTEPGPPLG
jgi:hypothetical protein